MLRTGLPCSHVLAVLIQLKTRSTIEVAHFRYFVSERRCSLAPNRRNGNLDFGKQKRFADLGYGITRQDAF